MGRMDILINNAGTNKPQAIDDITDEAWDEVLEIDLSSVMVLTRPCSANEGARMGPNYPHLLDHGVYVQRETQRLLGHQIGVARAGPAGALDLGTFGITVNCIAPGPFLTDLPKSVLSEAENKTRPITPPSAGGAIRESWLVPRCCWPARPAAISPVRPSWSTAAFWLDEARYEYFRLF